MFNGQFVFFFKKSVVPHYLNITLSHCLKLHSTVTKIRSFLNDTLSNMFEFGERV